MSDTTEPIDEMIKHEGDKWVLYTKDGSKRLGTHPTKEKAEAQERAIEAGKARAGEGFVQVVASGAIELAEGGRYALQEDDMARLSDGNLKKLRATMVEKRAAIRTSQADLDDQARYGSPEGSALLDDLYYYNMCISRLESEMACRMITLD